MMARATPRGGGCLHCREEFDIQPAHFEGVGGKKMLITVASYSGYRADERPLRFLLGGREYQVLEVEDRWYSPQAMYFRVVASDGNRYVICHDEARDVWSLEAFRAQ